MPGAGSLLLVRVSSLLTGLGVVALTTAVDALAYGLAALSLRQRVLAQNIANINTPGYRPAEVPFAAYLRSLLASGAPLREQPLPPVHVDAAFLRSDGNGVDVDAVMAALAENTLLFRATAQELGAQLRRVRTAIGVTAP
ncbi:MAG: flagellar biosynthesis protein FlgB [Clostridia bacterium]|nr:flagellar biosynthesis protein FlgB [Clostridia bacterium]